MRPRPMQQERPSIRVHVHQAVDDARLIDLLLGMEEEGVPAEVSRHDELDPLVLAHDAAVQSRLGVGVGVSLDYAVVTLEKLTAERPYLAEWWGADALHDRMTGGNAARLVKRTPLRTPVERNQ